MDYLPDLETLSHWLLEYGSIALFILLALGIIAIPVPEETLMVIAGTLMASGFLHIVPTIIAAFLGSVCGITTSYFLGHTVGIYFVHKYGPYVGIKKATIAKVHVWFEKYGKWAVFIGYFVPGIRHFTGFVAGTSDLRFSQFALFAYTGALVWVSTFLSFGYFFGNYCVNHCENLELADTRILIVGGALVLIVLGLWAVKKRRTRKPSKEE